MSEQFDGGPPLLTDVIDRGLDEIEQTINNRLNTLTDPHIEILRAQLPELFERALMRIKPQLLSELEQIVLSALKK